MTDSDPRFSAATEYEPVLKKLRFTRDVMKRARMDGKSCLMSIWEQDLQGVEEAIEILSSDGGVENQRHAARGLRTPKTAQDGQEGGPLGSAPEQGHPEKHIAGVVSGPSETIITDDAQAAPVGWVLAPKEPTDAMCEAMLARIEEAQSGKGAPFKWPDIEHMFDIYTDALAASQPSLAATVETTSNPGAALAEPMTDAAVLNQGCVARPNRRLDSSDRGHFHSSAATGDDLTAGGAWNDGCDFAMTQLCIFLGVDQNDVRWDAATETVDGDVQAVIGNILRAKFGEDWGPDVTPTEPQQLTVTRECQCAHPMIECGQTGCRCRICGEPERLPSQVSRPHLARGE